MTLEQRAEEMADYADQCCYRAGAWWKEGYDFFLKHLKEATNDVSEEAA